MIAGAIPTRWRGRGVRAVISHALLACANAALAYLAACILFAAATGGFDALRSDATAPLSFVLATAIYLASHGLRILRLGLLIGGWRVGLRTIASFHLMTAAVSLAAPWKLGEVYRIAALTNVVDGFARAVAIVWWERAFDVSAILLVLIVALAGASGTVPPEFAAVAALAMGFITLTALVFFVVPDNLRRLSVLIIRRYSDRRTVPVLRLVDQARTAILEAPRMVRGKVASLATLTVLIWACEISCVGIVFPGVTLVTALDSLLTFLSTLTRGETLLGALGNGEATSFREYLLAYLTATQIPLVVLGLGAAVHYAALRIRQPNND